MKKSLRIRLLEILGPLIQKMRFYVLRFRGYSNISKNVILERNLNLDRVYPTGINIEECCLIASNTSIICHEHVYRDKDDPELPLRDDIYIGKRCFIGVGSIILPGAVIGDDCIIGAGSIVRGEIPSGSIAVGSPARVVRSGIRMDNKARLIPNK